MCVYHSILPVGGQKNESRYACIIISYLLKHVCVCSLFSRAECVDESGNSTRQSVAMAGHPGAWLLPAEKVKMAKRQSAKIEINILLFQPRK